MVVCPQVTLIHSKVALADKELLPCVRQEVKEILLQKGVQLLLSTCQPPLALPPPCPSEIGLRGLVTAPSMRVATRSLCPGAEHQSPFEPWCRVGGCVCP